MVLVPVTEEGNYALNIVARYVPEGKLVKLTIEMGKPSSIQSAADIICSYIGLGKTVALAVLGEPSLYSTAFKIYSKMRCKQNLVVEVVPGVSAIYSCADRVPLPVASTTETIAVVPASRIDVVKSIAGLFENIIVIKNNENTQIILDILRKAGYRLIYVENCFTSSEKIVTDLDIGEIKGFKYMSILIAKKDGLT